MALSVVKFSEFTNGGDLSNDKITVGLGGSAPYHNAQYNNPWTYLPEGSTGDRPAIAASMYYRQRLNTSLHKYEYYDPILGDWVQLQASNVIEWVTVTTSPYQMIANQSYVANSASLINLILPVTSVVGDQIGIASLNTGNFIISQAAGQSIKVAPISTTVGVAGSLAGADHYNSIYLVCIEDNLTWSVLGGPQGVFTYI